MNVDPSTSFLAHAYDATYVGAFGVVHATLGGNKTWDGTDVAAGMANLSAGKEVELAGPDAWIKGSGIMVSEGQMNSAGASGQLDFDAKAGEAPGRIEVWGVVNGVYETLSVVAPN